MSQHKNAAVSFEKREQGFSMGNLQAVKLKEYNALFDPNMKHFFENKQNQYLLYKTGQIDSHGRIIDLEKNQSKLFILEREFREAEKVEEKRQKEEMEMRVLKSFVFFVCMHDLSYFLLQYRVQRKRFNELEKSKKLEILEKLKAERELSKEIVSTLRMSSSGALAATRKLSGTDKGKK